MGRADFLYSKFRDHFQYEPTDCQDAFLHQAAEFLTADEGDILVLNGYAGTGKTTHRGSEGVRGSMRAARAHRKSCQGFVNVFGYVGLHGA